MKQVPSGTGLCPHERPFRVAVSPELKRKGLPLDKTLDAAVPVSLPYKYSELAPWLSRAHLWSSKWGTMPVIAVEQDPEIPSVTIVAEFPVPLRRLWDAYVDPRQLERFWGPPEWPATFTRHDVRLGGRSDYHMTGPDGEQSAGFWIFENIDAPHSFEVRDGFSQLDGTPNTELPSMRMVFEFEDTQSGSQLTTTTYFNSAAELEQLLDMGMLEGTQAAMGQIDEVVTDDSSWSSQLPTQMQYLTDTIVRVSRVLRGSVDQVWRAHHDPELVREWMLGPKGWHMPVCEIGETPGDTYRYEWETLEGRDRFGFTGEVLEIDPPHRDVVTEGMIGMDGPGTTNAMNLVDVADGTLLTLVITYPNVELRDEVLATGMVDGMESSYARLETLLASEV